jgi:lysophospholipase L1-like esterase
LALLTKGAGFVANSIGENNVRHTPASVAALPSRLRWRSLIIAFMKLSTRWRRKARFQQRNLGFLDRTLRRERMFKQWIFVATGVVIVIILTAAPWGRDLTTSVELAARRNSRGLLWHDKRTVIDGYWRDYRRHGIVTTQPRIERFYSESSPADQRLMRYAAMDPEHGLLRWGNVTWTILLSAKVFEADETGRSYRLRPSTRSIWLKRAPSSVPIAAFYLVPDGPGLAEALEGTGASPIETSRQTTNSWGLRGPEPELNAAVRILVVGDSFMQGMFIGDAETPPECLRRDLERRLKSSVSVLNTGLMGYSPEQYYHTLLAFEARFTPHAVVISLCANDFGNVIEAVGEGKGDWDEGKYWLQKIVKLCNERHWAHVFVPVPYRSHVVQRRKPGFYPGAILNVLNDPSVNLLDPLDDFVNAHLDAEIAGRQGPASDVDRLREQSALFNDPLNDDHFSALGSEVWARSVGRRLVLLLSAGSSGPKPSDR